MDTVLQKKILLTEILSAETAFVLQYVQQHKLITDRDYRALKSLPQNTDRTAFELLDKLRDKGEETCQRFLGLLRQRSMLEQYPRLREIFTDLRQGTEPAEVRLKLKSSYTEKFKCIYEGTSEEGEHTFLSEIFTDLYVVEGFTGDVCQDHEALQMEEESSRRSTTEQTAIDCKDIFRVGPEKQPPIRVVLTLGIAGIGKTVSVQKFVLDWAEGASNQDVDFIFVLPFRELNLVKDEKFSLLTVLCYFHPELEELKEAHIYKESKIVFIFDGLDENQISLDFERSKKISDITKESPINLLIINLIRGELLPSALIWITSRPAAANQISRKYIQRVTEIKGFSDAQMEEYLKRRVSGESEVQRMISHIRKSRSLYVMCHIPVFCRITITVLQKKLGECEQVKNDNEFSASTTLTEMYLRFLLIQTHHMNERCGRNDGGLLLKLAKLAFSQLEKGNIVFYATDLKLCGIDVRQALVDSGIFTQVVKSEGKVFSFIHLSLQEFLSALYVFLAFTDDNINILQKGLVKTSMKFLRLMSNTLHDLHKTAIEGALHSPNGHLDLLLRFILGLSLESSQRLLKELRPETHIRLEGVRETVDYIKKKLNEDLPPERSINLLHCLGELKDNSLLAEVQKFLEASESLSSEKLSSAQWSALLFVLQMSGETQETFELWRYRASGEALDRLLPMLKNTRRALLDGCNLNTQSCVVIASVLQTANCPLRKLDLSNNNIKDSGVELLCGGLENPHCKLETLKLAHCDLTAECCSRLASVMMSAHWPLTQLDLSNNDLTDAGVKLLCAGLREPQCNLQILRLSGCLVTEEGCRALASALGLNPSHLKELDLSYNHPGDSALELLTARLNQQCQLNVDHGGQSMIRPGLRKYVCELTMDADTVHGRLSLSGCKRRAIWRREIQSYPEHPQRFAHWPQVVCREALSGRCYWETDWHGFSVVAATYKGLARKGQTESSRFSLNADSWGLWCFDFRYVARHKTQRVEIAVPPSDTHAVGVYLDWPSGSLSFYSIASHTHTLTHLHTFRSTFTEPLYAGFGFGLAVADAGLGATEEKLRELQEQEYHLSIRDL